MPELQGNVWITGNLSVAATSTVGPGSAYFRMPAGWGEAQAVYLISAGTGSGDLPALIWRDGSATNRLSIWPRMSDGMTRIKSGGTLALHAGNADVGNGSHERMTIDGVTGNVGVGVNAPQAPLHIQLASSGNGSEGRIRLATTGAQGGGRTWDVGVSHAQFQNFGFNIRDAQSPYPQPALTVNYDHTSTGSSYVGIGTDVPMAPLQIGDDRGALTPAAPAREGWLRLATTNRQGGSRAWDIMTSHARNYHFYIRDVNAATDRLMIRYDTGFVGIGTSDPLTTLGVQGGIRLGDSSNLAGTANALTVRRAGADSAPYLTLINEGTVTQTVMSGGSGRRADLVFTNDAGGDYIFTNADNTARVGIGTTTPASHAKLHVAGKAVIGDDLFVANSINAGGTDGPSSRKIADASGCYYA